MKVYIIIHKPLFFFVLFIYLFIIATPFDPLASRTFKASCHFESGDEGHVYNQSHIDDNTFNISQLMSIQLYDIVTSFGVSTECHRQLVGFANTLIRDHAKLIEGNKS